MYILRVFYYLLVYVSCIRGFHCDIYICAYNVSCLDSSLHSAAPLLTQLQQVSLFYFHTRIQCTHHIHPSPSPFTLPLPSSTGNNVSKSAMNMGVQISLQTLLSILSGTYLPARRSHGLLMEVLEYLPCCVSQSCTGLQFLPILSILVFSASVVVLVWGLILLLFSCHYCCF
jgi:hypothetical protein